jgi:D-glycero-alpha-D-manno-heptose-7-phosphate kinase
MIISRTPFRVSLFGGGTDYPAWFRNYGGGAVVGMAIDKYCYLSVRRLPPFFKHRSRIVYSKIELVRHVKSIRHPAVRGVLSDLGVSDGLEIHHDADLPARSGLGSSSSFTVGLLNALHALEGRMVTKRQLAESAIRIEQDVLKEEVGCQDQLWAAYGGLNRMDFRPDGRFSVTPLILAPERQEELLRSLILVFTGFSRLSVDFAQEITKNIKIRDSQLMAMRGMVDDAVALLSNERTPLRELGDLLHNSWQLKRQLTNRMSNSSIDDIYDAGRAAGAYGGKLLGAGGGGFLLFMVDPSRRECLLQRLKKLIHVSVKLDNEGSKIVLYEPNGL